MSYRRTALWLTPDRPYRMRRPWRGQRSLTLALRGAERGPSRRIATTSLAPQDLAVLRYAIPALLLLPIAWRAGLWPRAVPRRLLLFMFVGAGLPFGLVAMSGTQFAPAAHMGVMMAGAAPLFAAALAWGLWRERPDRPRAFGLGLMCLGVALLGAKSVVDIADGAWRSNPCGKA